MQLPLAWTEARQTLLIVSDFRGRKHGEDGQHSRIDRGRAQSVECIARLAVRAVFESPKKALLRARPREANGINGDDIWRLKL